MTNTRRKTSSSSDSLQIRYGAILHLFALLIGALFNLIVKHLSVWRARARHRRADWRILRPEPWCDLPSTYQIHMSSTHIPCFLFPQPIVLGYTSRTPGISHTRACDRPIRSLCLTSQFAHYHILSQFNPNLNGVRTRY